MKQPDRQSRQGKCPGTNRQGEPCRKSAGWGTNYRGIEGALCVFHTGATPNGQKHNQRLAAEQAARKYALELVGVDLPLEDAGERLLWLISISSRMIQFYAGQVQQLEEQAFVQGVQTIRESRDADGRVERVTTVGAAAHMWVQLLDRERSKLGVLCRDALHAGVEERMVRLAESQGQAIVRLIDAVLGELGVDVSDGAVAATVARHLRAL